MELDNVDMDGLTDIQAKILMWMHVNADLFNKTVDVLEAQGMEEEELNETITQWVNQKVHNRLV